MSRFPPSTSRVYATAVLLGLAAVTPCGPTIGTALAAAESAAGEDADSQTLLQADLFSYDENQDVVTASGNVEIQQGEHVLLANKVVYDRVRDVATATGNVSLIEPTGTVIYVESIQITGDLKEALAGELRALMADKSRMTSRAFRRMRNGMDELYETAYTACDVCEGKSALWRLRADKVRRDINERMIYYNDVWLDLLGIPVFYTPYLASPDPTAGRKSGFLMPSIGGGSNLGGSYAQPYYLNIASDSDATITPFVSSNAGKGVTMEYRQEFQHGRVKIFGSGVGGDPATPGDWRGNFRSTARWDIDDRWRSGADFNLASDRTYLRRYASVLPGPTDTAKPWLVNNAFLERFGRNSYFSANAYYFQRQLSLVARGAPIVAPLIYYNYTSDPLSWGGYLKVDASGVVLTRSDGTDSSRLSTTVSWNLPFTTPQGYVITARAAVRADGYYVRDFVRPSSGLPFTGSVGRVFPEASIEWRWPLERASEDFTQVIEPVAMFMAAPIARNPDTIPNEDSSNFEFDDTNLFETQRLAGYDRVEGGARVAYGVRWSAFYRDGGTVSAFIGQSYRFHNSKLFAPRSGLYDKLSDYVGRVDFSPNQYISLQYRFRVDKDTFANRRTEITGVVGPEVLRTLVSYIDIPPTDPAAAATARQRELFTSVRAKVSRYWSVTASHRQKLGTGGGAIRSGLGIGYEDECFIFNLAVARDNTSDRDFKSGVGVLLRFGFKTIGDLKLNTDVGAGR